jgi:hypothetical protein
MCGLRRGFVPSWHNPKLRRDLDRCELRLRQTDPILFGHFLYAQMLTSDKEILWGQQTTGVIGSGTVREQSDDARTLPTLLGRGHTRLTKQGLLGICLCIGIFDRHTQSSQCIQRIAHRLHMRLWAKKSQLNHQRL